MFRLGIVLVSVREGRAGEAVTAWAMDRARAHGGFDVERVDLKAVDLPLLNEPHHPKLKKYTSPKTQAWSARVEKLDAFLFVTPEYNHGTPPALSNALDHLYSEWSYKAAAFVSYGGISGGVRGVQMTKPRLLAFNMMPIVDGVPIPFVAKQIRDGRFEGTEAQDKAVASTLDELSLWTSALASLRKRS